MSIKRFAALAVLGLAAPLHANDSEAAVGLGGIELVRNETVSMDSEDLYLSAKEVRVRYRYTNHAARPVELTIAFPLPVLRAADAASYGDQAIPDFSALDFHTEVDGRPVKLEMVRRAEIKGRDVTQRVTALGWRVDWIDGTGEEPDFVRVLSPAQRKTYLQEGLLTAVPDLGEGVVLPAWDVATLITRKQVFPAHASVTVTHRYKPMLGGSVGGGLEPGFRESDPEHVRQYCVDQPFLATFDRKLATQRRTAPDTMAYSETWLSYILSSGRNWKGPIGDFRLVVDKGRADSLVSFCMDGAKKITPTQFEVHRINFEPEGDLDVLIIDWSRP